MVQQCFKSPILIKNRVRWTFWFLGNPFFGQEPFNPLEVKCMLCARKNREQAGLPRLQESLKAELRIKMGSAHYIFGGNINDSCLGNWVCFYSPWFYAPIARNRTIPDGLAQNIMIVTDPPQLGRFSGSQLFILNNTSLTPLRLSFKDSLNGFRIKPIILPEVLAEHIAYMLHTSGSTGQPKRVMMSNVSSANALLNLTSRVNINQIAPVLITCMGNVYP